MTKRILLAACAALVSVTAFAQTPPEGDGQRRGGGWLMKADANNDGVVTWAEAQAAATVRFQKMDANHDGVLSADEQPAGRGGNAAQGDAKLTAVQFIERAKNRFDRLDTNHDGQIDAAEIQAMRDRMAARGN